MALDSPAPVVLLPATSSVTEPTSVKTMTLPSAPHAPSAAPADRAEAVVRAEAVAHRRVLSAGSAEARGAIVAPAIGRVVVHARPTERGAVEVTVRAEEPRAAHVLASSAAELTRDVRIEVPNATVAIAPDVRAPEPRAPEATSAHTSNADVGDRSPKRDASHDRDRDPHEPPAAHASWNRRPLRARFVL